MLPEPDADRVFEDIKSGVSPPRAKDRGLTVRHLERFFDPAIFSEGGTEVNFYWNA